MHLEDIKRFGRGHRYELVAVMDGFIIMVLEIVGARMVAPYFGTSVYVWTAVIGVILGALSFGYWFGGRLADRGASDRQLARIMQLAALVLLVTVFAKDSLLDWVAGMGADVRVGALLAAIVLFAPANVLFGIVSPYLVKLKLTSLSSAGSSVGGLYAAGTLGSILGTFAAGYWLITVLGSRALGIWLVIGLLAASVVVWWRGDWRWRIGLAMLATGILLSGAQLSAENRDVQFDGDSAYSRYQIVDVTLDRPRRLLVTDNQSAQSGIYLDNPDEPAFKYIENFVAAAKAGDKPEKVLLIGGGAFTLPPLILKLYPQSQIDVVEIDPYLTQLAKNYFGYTPDPRVRVINEDGRTFINREQAKYDLIFVDAFTAVTPPFQLTTTQAVKRLQALTAPGGAVVVNLISAIDGADAAFGEAEFATYRNNFDIVTARGQRPEAPDISQNILLVAGESGGRAKQISDKLGLSARAFKPGKVLTDDFAPVEQMTAP